MLISSMVHVKNPDNIEERVVDSMLMADIDPDFFHVKIFKDKCNKKSVKDAIKRMESLPRLKAYYKKMYNFDQDEK
jgi:hypothetical protein